jgi:hypothetical protein
VALKLSDFLVNLDILRNGGGDLGTTLRRQREAIEEKRRRLQQAVKAIQRAEYVIAAKGQPGWELFTKIIEVINMQNDMDWTKKYYSEEAQREIEKRAETIAPSYRTSATLSGLLQVEAAVAAKRIQQAKIFGAARGQINGLRRQS